MHIPDGYLGPQTYVPLLGVMGGFWSVALAKLRRTLRLRQVPLLALGAAFSFVIMMFNVPIPGGTTGHAVGGVLVAILLGPWAAMVAVSLALIIQALLFGDGGLTAIGANCFNMGVVMPFIGWGVYRLVAGSSPPSAARRWIGGAVAGYVGLCAAAIATGFEFGLQPLLAQDAAGRPLYCPFGLSIAVPAMALEHLLVFGFVEAVVTGLVLKFLQRTAPELLTEAVAPSRRVLGDRIYAGGAAIIGILVLLSPLGLYLPERFKAGSAWGEWSSEEIRAEVAKQTGDRAGYVPRGLEAAERSGWRAPLPDYALPGQESAPLSALSVAYLLAGLIGVIVIGGLILMLRRVWAPKDEPDDASSLDLSSGR